MKPPRTPQFLGRDSYRMRRVMDAARILPVFGLILLLLPLMRHSPEFEAPPTAAEAVYLFMVWAVLIIAAFLLSLWLRRALDPSESSKRRTPQNPARDTQEE
jgi:hypothetical protein